MNLSFALNLSAAALCTMAMCGGAQSPYQVVDRWKVGGTGGWDYLAVDATQHRLYVSHNARVEVIDTTNGNVVGAVTGMKSTHGIAFDTDGNTGYISDGQGNAIVVFDRRTLATLATVAAGTNPDGIAFEPTTHTVWAFNGRSNNVSVLDAATRTVVATIGLPGKPEFPQADGKGSVFVNIEDKNSMVRLDAARRTATATWRLPGCESPSGMAMDVAGSRLFSVCDGKKMAVTDATSGKQLALADIGDAPDAAGYDASAGLAFSSNGDGTLTVVNTKGGYRAVQTVTTAKGARTMAYDAEADRIYLSSAVYGPAPAATSANAHPRPAVMPGSFTILVVGRN